MKKYITPAVEMDVISKNDVIMLSGEPVRVDGEILVSAPSAWFGMGMEIE